MDEQRFVSVSPSVWTRVGDVEIYNMLGCVIVAQIDKDGAVITFGPTKVRPVRVAPDGPACSAWADLLGAACPCRFGLGHAGAHEYVLPDGSTRPVNEPCGHRHLGLEPLALSCQRPKGHGSVDGHSARMADGEPLIRWFVDGGLVDVGSVRYADAATAIGAMLAAESTGGPVRTAMAPAVSQSPAAAEMRRLTMDDYRRAAILEAKRRPPFEQI